MAHEQLDQSNSQNTLKNFSKQPTGGFGLMVEPKGKSPKPSLSNLQEPEDSNIPQGRFPGSNNHGNYQQSRPRPLQPEFMDDNTQAPRRNEV